MVRGCSCGANPTPAAIPSEKSPDNADTTNASLFQYQCSMSVCGLPTLLLRPMYRVTLRPSLRMRNAKSATCNGNGWD